MQLAAAPGTAAVPNQQGFVGGQQQQQQQGLLGFGSPAGTQPGQLYGPSSQQQQQQQQGANGLAAALAAMEQHQSLLAPLQQQQQQQQPHQDLGARLAAASSPGEVLSIAGERGMGLFTEHLVMGLAR
jgi:hypothetical protein